MAEIGSAFIKMSSTWTTLKAVVAQKNLSLQYDDTGSTYDIFALDGFIVYSISIFKGSVPGSEFNQVQNDLDKADFEANYKNVVTNRAAGGSSVAVDGYAITTANPSMVAGSDGSLIRTLRTDSSGRLFITGQGIAGTPAGGVLSIQGVSGGQAVPISGSITASNASIGSTGTAAPASATLAGGKDGSGNLQALKVSATGVLSIDGSAVTQPVSGTVTANIGTSGSLALDSSVSGLSLSQGVSTSGQRGALLMGAATSAAPTYTTATANALSLTTSGALRVDASATTQPISGTVTSNAGTGNFGVNLTQLSGNAISSGNGVSGTGTIRVAIASDNTAFSVNSIQSGTWNITNVSGTVSLPTGASTSANQSTEITSLQLIDDIVHATNGTFSKAAAIAGQLDDTSTTAATEDGVSPVRITAQRAIHSNIRNASGTEVGTASNAFRVDPTGATSQPVTGTVTANAGSGNFNIVGTGTAGTAAAGVVTVQGIAGGTAIPVSGTFTATNPSVSATGAAPPASATYAGGSVTTASPSYTTGQMSALSLTTSGSLRVDGSGATQPVSGTITANIGTSGSLALDSTLAKLTISQSTALGSNTQTLIGGSVTATAPTYTTGNINPLSLTTSGALRIDGSAVTQPISGTVTANAGTGNFSTNLAQIAGATTSTGNGVAGTGVQRVAIASDNTAFAVNAAQSGTWNITNVSGTISLPTGAATSSLQTTGNTSLSSIDTKTPALGQAVMASSTPVVIASNQSAVPTSVSIYTSSGSTTLQNAAVAIGDGTLLAVTGYGTAVFTVIGTFAGKISFEGTVDGTNFCSIHVIQVSTGTISNQAQTPGIYRTSCAGITQIRARISEYTSGSITVTGIATNESASESNIEVDFQKVHTDAFQRLRISSPTTVFDGKALYDEQAIHFVESFVSGGSAAMVTNQPIRRLTLTTANAASAIRQTRRYFAYQAGKSHQIMLTFTFGAAVSNVRRRAGYFDSNNGLFLEQTSAATSFVRRTFTSGSAVDSVVSQASWNLDTLDGTGPSGIVLDLSKSQLLVIDFQWLGTGQVRMGFSIGSSIIYCHAFDWSNSNVGVYMATPALPVRWEIVNTNTSAGASLDCICCSVASESGTSYPGVLTSVDRGVSVQTFLSGNGTAMKPILSVRAKSAFTRMTVIPETISVLCTTTSLNGFRWALLLNPTITGGTAASWTSISNSGLEFDIAQTGTVTQGYQVASGYGIGQVNSVLSSLGILSLGADVAGTRDTYVLAVAQITGAAESYIGQMQLRETI